MRRALVLMLVLSVAKSMYGQSTNASLTGYVTDASKGVVVDAKVTVTNTGTDISSQATTDGSGSYYVANLPPGNYRIQVEKSGFSTAVNKDVTIHVQDTLAINFELAVGSTAESVTVEGGAPTVQLETSAVGNLVDSHTVVDLPLNGRDWTSLTQLEPGVVQVRTQLALGIANDRPNRGLGTDVSIGGNRPQQNNYRIDGVSINDQSSGAPGSVAGTVLGVDAIQEYSVVTSNAPADYGKTSGGVINAVTRSGVNKIHGTGYEFLRNNVLDARNYFDAPKIPPFKRNQFGGSVGGPIIKDRAFFFANYEGFRQSQGITNLLTVPSQSPAQLAATDPLVLPYLQLYPKPNTGSLSGTDPFTTGKFSFVSQQVTNENFFTTRIDDKLSAADSLFGTFLMDRGEATSPDALDFKNVGTRSRRYTVAIEETHTFRPTLLNTARFGFNRTVSIAPTTLNAINPAAADTSLGFDPGQPVGIINTSGIAQFTGGIGAIGEYDYHYNSFQGYDDLYWTKGKHLLKIGFNTERIQDNQLTRGANPDGQYKFGSLQGFLQNQPTSFNSFFPNLRTPKDLRQSIYGVYIQDDYKFSRVLTLNLGLRYETATVPTETANRLSTFVNFQTDTQPKLGSPYFPNFTRHNFEPRVGFAWDPTGSGRTSIRGAFGVYDVLPLPYQFALLTLLSTPFAESGRFTFPSGSSGGFPTGGFPNLTASSLRYGYVDQHPRRDYVEQWSLSLQREIFRNFTVTAGYIGSHGVHQPFHADDINQVLPTLTPQGWAWPAAKNGTPYNPNVGQISTNMWTNTSTYNGGTLSAIQRLRHGVQIQGAYTYSKSIDTGSSGIAGDTFGNSVSSLPWFDPRLRRGPSDFDVRHTLAINGLWMIPGPTSWNGVPKWFASGWQIGGIFTLSSGLPFTPTLGGDPLGENAADTYAFPDKVRGCNPVASNFKSNGLLYVNTNCFSFPATDLPSNTTLPRLLGNAGRNSVYGPGLRELDFSLFKNTPIHRLSETFNVQFRWEVFNILNHTNFLPPDNNTQIFDSSGNLNSSAGLLDGTSTTSRQMQFGLKLIW